LVVASVAALLIAVPAGLTPTERVAASLGKVPDPTTSSAPNAPTTRSSGAASSSVASSTTTTTCAPAVAPSTSAGNLSPSESVLEDPTATACTGQLKVMVVGDSTGRGAANGLSAVGDPRLQVWDRTVLGCSFGDEKCPDWKTAWQLDVERIDPDVVLLYAGVVPDLHGVDDAPFLSDTEGQARAAAFDEAHRILSSKGAKVLYTVPPVPLRPNGLFFCDGKATDSACDAAWVARWSDDVRAAALRTGSGVVDVKAWADARGSTKADRPDGVHFGRDTLRDEGAWLAPQIVAASGT
jgi:hypothetical protein